MTLKVNADKEYIVSEKDIENLLKTKQDFLDGKTTALNWTDIEEDLNRAYDQLLNYPSA